MSDVDALAYSGDVQPEELSEPILFKFAHSLGIASGMVAGIAAFLLLAVLDLCYVTVFDPLAQAHGLGVVISSIAVGLTTALAIMRRLASRQVIVSRHGILVLKSGRVIQDCEWADMTVRDRKLSDQNGLALSTAGLQGREPDARLARLAIRTRLRQLLKAQPVPRRRRLKWVWVFAYGGPYRQRHDRIATRRRPLRYIGR